MPVVLACTRITASKLLFFGTNPMTAMVLYSDSLEYAFFPLTICNVFIILCTRTPICGVNTNQKRSRQTPLSKNAINTEHLFNAVCLSSLHWISLFSFARRILSVGADKSFTFVISNFFVSQRKNASAFFFYTLIQKEYMHALPIDCFVRSLWYLLTDMDFGGLFR